MPIQQELTPPVLLARIYADLEGTRIFWGNAVYEIGGQMALLKAKQNLTHLNGKFYKLNIYLSIN